MYRLHRGLIVSCQATKDEPLYGIGIMTKMALAAKAGGAVGLRANGIEDIIGIKKVCNLPIIGIVKRVYSEYEVYITPSMVEVEELIHAGSDIIALDATMRPRPGFDSPEKFINEIKRKYNQCVMAYVSTYEEGINAFKAGADIIATTLSGYTAYTLKRLDPDINLVKKLSDSLEIPVIAEGNIETPQQAVKCLKAGAFAVVVGSAITRPQMITKRFVDEINEKSLTQGG